MSQRRGMITLSHKNWKDEEYIKTGDLLLY